MNVNVTSSDALGARPEAETARPNKMAEEKETFLKLLVAQISNQDPMSPQSSEQYVQQLTQFSNVEQLMSLNQGVDRLAVGQLSNNNQQALRFVGREVTARGDNFSHEKGTPSEVAYNVDDTATDLTVVITDENGREVHRADIPAPAGRRGTYTWNGADDEGIAAEDGRYTIAIEARNEEGEIVPADTLVSGRVTGVRFDKGFPELLMGDRVFRLSDIQEVGGDEEVI